MLDKVNLAMLCKDLLNLRNLKLKSKNQNNNKKKYNILLKRNSNQRSQKKRIKTKKENNQRNSKLSNKMNKILISSFRNFRQINRKRMNATNAKRKYLLLLL